VSDDLHLAAGPGLRDGLVIPGEELTERFSRSSGPGGQGVNTTDSRVELSWDVATSSALTETQRDRLVLRLGARSVDGVVTIAASEHRSQLQNRLAARQRLAALVSEGLTPPTIRRATRPSRAAKQARLDSKRRHADIKSGRGRIRPD
jgi:ribosome-associated protein